jgi:hypothetical protein
LDDIHSDTQIPEHPVGLDDLLRLAPGDDENFDRLARSVYDYQTRYSPAYRVYAEDSPWSTWTDVPFLPVEAFKWPGVTGFPESEAEAIFLSSATGGVQSRHPVRSLNLYETLAIEWFRACVGEGPFTIIAHLPTYTGPGRNSSLIHMVRTLMDAVGGVGSQFLTDSDELRGVLQRSGANPKHRQLLVFGTAFGLLDFIEDGAVILPKKSLVIETGGMKSRRRQVDRTTLHQMLSEGFGLSRERIRSEYGMCEMLSQFYTAGGNTFRIPPWVRCRVVDVDDPSSDVRAGEIGLLAIFDAGNVGSVSPILTEDLARLGPDGLEVVGRLTGAELRGCNFLFETGR